MKKLMIIIITALISLLFTSIILAKDIKPDAKSDADPLNKFPDDEDVPDDLLYGVPDNLKEHVINLYSHDPIKGTKAAESLGEIGDKRTVRALIIALTKKQTTADCFLGRDCGDALDKIDPDWRSHELVDGVVLKLIKMLIIKDNDEAAVMGAADSLGIIGDKRAVEPLIAAFKQGGCCIYHRRQVVPEALGKIGDKRAVEVLIKGLWEEEYGTDNIVRHDCISALGELGDHRAIEPLIIFMQKIGEYQRKTLESLKKLTGEELGEDPETWLKWWKDNKEKYRDN